MTVIAVEDPKGNDERTIDAAMVLIAQKMDEVLVPMLRRQKLANRDTRSMGRDRPAPQWRRYAGYKLAVEKGSLDIQLRSIYDYLPGAWESATASYFELLASPSRRA